MPPHYLVKRNSSDIAWQACRMVDHTYNTSTGSEPPTYYWGRLL